MTGIRRARKVRPPPLAYDNCNGRTVHDLFSVRNMFSRLLLEIASFLASTGK